MKILTDNSCFVVFVREKETKYKISTQNIFLSEIFSTNSTVTSAQFGYNSTRYNRCTVCKYNKGT